MSSVRAGGYRDVLTLPHALPTFGPALLGRLSYGLLPLSLLFTVQQTTGSFATAGATTAMLGLTSLVLPHKSRLLDRHGQARVLPGLASGAAAALTVLALLALHGPTSELACLALATVAGLLAPPLGPAMRANWRTLTRGTSLRTSAYSLDAVCEESLYLLGPMIVGLVLAVGPAAWALLGTAGLMLVGTLGMVRAAPTEPPRPRPQVDRGRRGGSSVVPELHGVLVLVLVSTGGISLAYTGVAARAQVAGHPAAAGWIEAAVAVGSVAGGMLWGRRRHRRGHHAHLAGLVALLGVGIGVAGLTPGLGGLGLVMGATGVAVAPLFVVAYLAVDDRAPEDRRTEASTWVNTFGNVGGALGSAVAGVLVQHVTVTAPFEVGAVVLLCASVAATGFGGRDTPRAPLSGG